jgi:hypothetical protein
MVFVILLSLVIGFGIDSGIDVEVEEIMLLFFWNGKVWVYFIILGMVIEYLRWGFY